MLCEQIFSISLKYISNILCKCFWYDHKYLPYCHLFSIASLPPLATIGLFGHFRAQQISANSFPISGSITLNSSQRGGANHRIFFALKSPHRVWRVLRAKAGWLSFNECPIEIWLTNCYSSGSNSFDQSEVFPLIDWDGKFTRFCSRPAF